MRNSHARASRNAVPPCAPSARRRRTFEETATALRPHCATAFAAPPDRVLWCTFAPRGHAESRSCQCSAAQAPARSVQGTLQPPGAQASHYRVHFVETGYLQAAVERSGSGCSLQVAIHGVRTKHPCFLHWGMFRSNASSWLLPESVIPKGSTKRDDLGAVRTPLQRRASDGALTASFQVNAAALPAHFACTVFIEDDEEGRYLQPRGCLHVAIPVGMDRGRPEPLGATLTAPLQVPSGTTAPFSVNFAVSSRHAEAMTLRLLRHDGERVSKIMDIALDPCQERTGDTWHVLVHNLKDAAHLAFVWIAEGQAGWQGRARFSPSSALLDPYAKQTLSLKLPESEQGGRTIIAGTLSAANLTDIWRDAERPRRAVDLSVLMEVDPASFAVTGHVKPGHEGKWLGVLDRVARIAESGVTGVVLRCPMLRGNGMGVQGEANISYFAPDSRFAVKDSGGAAAREFAQLVAGLHAAGIEVLLQSEFCFTAEGNDLDSKLLGLRGIDAELYYRPNALLNMAHPVVQRLIIDSLRYWIATFHVDGFVLLSAEAMAQDRDGYVQDCPPLVEAIARDPMLADCKMIAWPRDGRLLPRGGRRGFPHGGVLLQHCAEFRDVLLWLGGSGGNVGYRDARGSLLSRVATRLTGSADLFKADWSAEASLPGNLAAGRRPAFAVNSVSSPIVDGAGLAPWIDSVCPNDSINGSKRPVLWKTALMLLLLAGGTPMLAAVDVESREMSRFVAGAIAARTRSARLLCALKFESWRSVSWFDAHGHDPAWDSDSYDGVLGFVSREGGAAGAAVCVVINASHNAANATLPSAPAGHLWRIVLNTGASAPDDVNTIDGPGTMRAGSPLMLGPKSAAFLVAGRF